MSDRILSLTSEARLPGGPFWTLEISRAASGSPGLLFTIKSESADPKDRHLPLLNREMTFIAGDGNAVLAPVMEWLNKDGKLAVSETTEHVSGHVVARAVGLAKEIDAINLTTGEIVVAFGKAGKKSSAFYETDLFTTLNNHRDELRKQLLALTEKD